MLRNSENFFRLLLAVVLVMWGTMSVAQIDGDGNGTSLIGSDIINIRQAEARFRQECSSCHIAYPASMLPTESWRSIMAGLDKHFGSDASLPDEEIKEITFFLVENSVEGWGEEIAPLRITKTHWFLRKHLYFVVRPEIWESKTVKSPANCSACHLQAESGDFSKRNISMPE